MTVISVVDFDVEVIFVKVKLTSNKSRTIMTTIPCDHRTWVLVANMNGQLRLPFNHPEVRLKGNDSPGTCQISAP